MKKISIDYGNATYVYIVPNKLSHRIERMCVKYEQFNGEIKND